MQTGLLNQKKQEQETYKDEKMTLGRHSLVECLRWIRLSYLNKVPGIWVPAASVSALIWSLFHPLLSLPFFLHRSMLLQN
jgi:hypothetical protein